MSGDHNMNQTSAGWRKRQIDLDKKAENARELGLDYEPKTSMTDEDWEFIRIEMEARVRMMAVHYVIERSKEPSPIPLITDEEWEALNKENP